MSEQRIVCWFSCGAASAVATKLAIEENAKSDSPKELVVASIFLENEHEDSERFLRDCEQWFGQEIVVLRNEKYGASVDEVIKQTRYMSGARGARCTTELKKNVRKEWQRFDDIHVFGMHLGEQKRINQIIDAEPDIELWTVLIDQGYTKQDCFNVLLEAGIALPKMYQLGYKNNNCIGCLKAQSAGYWNKIRKDFPEVFATRARQEKLLNVSLTRMQANVILRDYPEVFEKLYELHRQGKFQLKINSKGAMMIPLRFLPEDAGDHKDLDIGACGFFCEKAA